ncbi:MAG: rhodanese-like domain-containing protein [Alphaproteobacteria bacterium]|nr:rhodanese-like domain-containing protein [Alphaproteobacteria bacterium]
MVAVLLALGFAPVTATRASEAPREIAGAITVDAKKIIELITTTPDLAIVNNRKPADYAAGHIEGAVRLIDTDVTAVSLAKHIRAKDRPVLFYCNGLRCGRAAQAAQKAVKLGYTRVYYYALGMDEWNKEGLPVVR